MHHNLRLLVFFLLAVVFVLLMIQELANPRVRRALVAVQPVEIHVEEADPTKFSGLNKDDLERLTAELQKLGFTRLRDYSATIPDQPAHFGFSRLLENSAECCFAEIIATSQAMTKGLPLPVAINSHLEDGWELGTSNARVLRMYYSDAQPGQLLGRNLARRAEVLQGLHIGVDADLSIDSYFARIRKRTAEVRRAMQRRRPLDELPGATAIETRRRYEWLGDYPKGRERRRIRKG